MIYEFVDPDHEYGGQFAWSMTRQQTYYGNGKAGPHGPIYIRAAPHHQPPPCDADSDGQVDEGRVLGVNCEDQRGETNLFNFPRGKHIRTLELPAPWNQELGAFSLETFGGDLGPHLGWTVSAPGDLDEDGEADYIAGAPFTDVGDNRNQGVLIVFLSG